MQRCVIFMLVLNVHKTGWFMTALHFLFIFNLFPYYIREYVVVVCCGTSINSTKYLFFFFDFVNKYRKQKCDLKCVQDRSKVTLFVNFGFNEIISNWIELVNFDRFFLDFPIQIYFASNSFKTESPKSYFDIVDEYFSINVIPM